ncbi:hypothetical protein D7O18_27110 [Salmonella enterica subsp. enterica serovar Muenchen]|nr:hypothetical protein [Salmonella enterica subsp. enterica serovar Muenchen]
MNKVMNEENRRRGGRNTLCRLFRSGRWFLCLALLCSAMLPGFAGAAPAGDSCENLGGGGDIHLKLPPSITLEPGMDNIPSIPPVTVNYKCIAPSQGDGQKKVAIVSLTDANNLISSLTSLGLTLKMTITDRSGGAVGHWTFPAPGGGIYPEYVEIGDSYKGNDGTGERTMTINATLSRNPLQSTSPGFYAIPSLSAFRLKPYYNSGSGPLLTSPAIRLQYVPTCFVRFQLDKNNINFGPVMTTDVGSSFSRTDNFTVTADVNHDCNSGKFGNLLGGYTPQLTGAPTYYLDLPLKVSFTLQGGGYISGNSILLYKQDTLTKNGLKLTITDPDNNPVKFGEIISPDAQSLPGNKLGEFSDGNFNAKKIYNVKLSATGEPVLTGKYNAQVLVKVEYY